MKIALAQFDIDWMNKKSNTDRICTFIEQANRSGADVLVFPEMALTGFSMHSQDASESVQGECLFKIKQVTAEKKLLVILGAAIVENKRYNNQALLIYNGEIITSYTKRHSFTFSGEEKYYTAGMKPLFFKFQERVHSIHVCYDLRFAEDFAEAGGIIDGVSFVIANWPKKRAEHWKALLMARALDTQSFIVGVNRCGEGDGIEYQGDSRVVSPFGDVCLDAKSDSGLFITTIDFTEVEKFRAQFRVHGPNNGANIVLV